MTNIYSQARINYYGYSATPTTYFDGVEVVVGGGSGVYSFFLAKYNLRKAIQSNFTMNIHGSTSNLQDCEVEVNINKVGGNYGILKLYVLVTESNIGSYNHVTRLMVPSQYGTNLDFVAQNNYQLTLPFTLDGSWDFEECEVIVYLQHNSTKEIFQAVKLSMNDFEQGIMADFEVNNQEVITGQSAVYTDLSSGGPISWDWTFEGGTPATHNGQTPPAITYNTPGLYDVTLTVFDGLEYDTKTLTDYITVSDHCEAQGGNSYVHISNVTLGDINNASDQSFYADYSYLSTDLVQGQVNVAITILNPLPNNGDDLGVWVDWNHDGDFLDTDELVICEPELPWGATGTGTFYFNVPEDAPLGSTRIRIRLKYFDADCGSSCGETTYGEVEDYSLNIVETADPPIADFNADNTMPAIDEVVSFYDLSQNSPITWDWVFDPATVTYTGGTTSQSQNPQVQFNEEGLYSVTLTVYNSGGMDSEVKIDYIDTFDPVLNLDIKVFFEGPFDELNMITTLNGSVPLLQPYNQSPWNYNGVESVIPMPANIVDWVILELRDAATPELATSSNILKTSAVLLRNDGMLVDLNGQPIIGIEASYNEGLFVVIHHRNHLSIMSSVNLIESAGTYTWDFTSNSSMAFGGVDAQNEIAPGMWGMIGGDSNADGVIDILDIDQDWTNAAGLQGYKSCDFNFDAEVNNIDKNEIIILNIDKSTFVP